MIEAVPWKLPERGNRANQHPHLVSCRVLSNNKLDGTLPPSWSVLSVQLL